MVAADEPKSVSSGESSHTIWSGQFLRWFCFAGVVLLVMMILILMVVGSGESEPEVDPEHRRRRSMFSTLSEASDPDYWMAVNHHDDMSSSSCPDPEVDESEACPQVATPLQYGMFHVYLFMQRNFLRLRHLIQCKAVDLQLIACLLKVLRNYKRNGITTREVEHMTCCIDPSTIWNK